MCVILDLLYHYQTIVLCLEKVVVLVIYKVKHCARVFIILRVLSRIVERVLSVCKALVLHEGLREEMLVLTLDLCDQLTHFSLEFEFNDLFILGHANGTLVEGMRRLFVIGSRIDVPQALLDVHR